MESGRKPARYASVSCGHQCPVVQRECDNHSLKATPHGGSAATGYAAFSPMPSINLRPVQSTSSFSICSKVCPLVSGSLKKMNTNPTTQIAAYSQNVPAEPSFAFRIGNV